MYVGDAYQSIVEQFTRPGNIINLRLKSSETGLRQRTTWRLLRTRSIKNAHMASSVSMTPASLALGRTPSNTCDKSSLVNRLGTYITQITNYIIPWLLPKILTICTCVCVGRGGNLIAPASLRYVGVIWFVFHVLQVLPIRFTLDNLGCISEFTPKHQHKLD